MTMWNEHKIGKMVVWTDKVTGNVTDAWYDGSCYALHFTEAEGKLGFEKFVTAPAIEMAGIYGLSTEAILPKSHYYSGSRCLRFMFYLRSYSAEPYTWNSEAKSSGSFSVLSSNDKT